MEEVEEITRILDAKNYYEVLQVNPNDDLDEKEDEVRESYLSKCLLLQPNQIEHPKLTDAYAVWFKLPFYMTELICVEIGSGI